jgi:hypothetical protein
MGHQCPGYAAILLASATVTSIRGFLASMRPSQVPAGAPCRAAQGTTALAPMIRRRRRSRCRRTPEPGLASGRALPRCQPHPCRQISAPIETVDRRCRGRQCHGDHRTHAGDGHWSLGDVVVSRALPDLSIEIVDSLRQITNYPDQIRQDRSHGIREIAGAVVEQPFQPADELCSNLVDEG